MTKLTRILAAAALLGASAATPAAALTTRAWVSGHGSDVSTCGSPASPCRTLQYAHDAIVQAGGEIQILDPAAYGAVTISKSISIVNDGVGTAGLQPGVAFILGVVNITAGANDIVTLRGLTVDGGGTGSGSGILVNSAASVTIANCTVRHFNSAGISVVPRTNSASSVSVNILDTLVLYGVGNPNYGVFVSPTLMAKATVVINRTTAAFAGGSGFHAASGDQAQTFMTITDSSAFGNGIGVRHGGTAETVRIAGSVITANTKGVTTGGAAGAYTYGDNEIDANGLDIENGPLTTLPQR